MSQYSGRLRGEDENYLTDVNQMRKLGLGTTISKKTYWLASRSAQSNEEGSTFWINTNLGGSVQIIYILNNGHLDLGFGPYYLRAVFTLRDDVKITGGSGTSSDPYTLGI